jgi:hypothetical protein
MFQDVANGVKRALLPQVWVRQYFRDRLDAAVAAEQAKRGEDSKYSLGDFIRDAVKMKMDRVLGPEGSSPGRT